MRVAHDVEWIPGIALALGGVFSVPHGVNLAKRLPERVLRGLFIVLMLASADGLDRPSFMAALDELVTRNCEHSMRIPHSV